VSEPNGYTSMPPWWQWVRRIGIFALGAAVIIDSLVEKNYPSLGKLIIGLLMVGVMPLDDLLRALTKHRGGGAS
jgi:hypothetical protein